ncbi:transmembrane and immunoglobulin domain-containing protein 1-like isoform X1 [Electrophorus electricus]|uniref:transmembrane and immunoglobulin domain-containing protein 1-like isoform X1 n=2 Tax=Electrophorus electricus TaxID=8005 RepID=UPI0015D0BEB9|nr:transmembrane and immunoglobulin domain-containing protein 1-like isoform X1 [Electrophorus electricus]
MSFMRTTQFWILIVTFCKTYHCQTVGLHQKPALVSAVPGEAITLNCTFEKHMSGERMLWYKQKSGRTFQEVGLKFSHTNSIIFPEFNKSGIKVETTESSISLHFPNVSKEDEGMYFCGIILADIMKFSSGTFLVVTGNPGLTISVVQSPVLGTVSPGESVSLQCTVLSERRTAELRVLWFRAATRDIHPEIIYTHHNSSHQCEISSSPHSCVYNFSKSVLSLSDTGTYYCAVVTCGKILLGNGTTVYMSSPLDPVVIFLGAALGVCVLVISAQAVLNCKRRNCEHCSVRLQHGVMKMKTTSQDHDAVELNYSALHFIDGKTRRRREKRGQTEHSVYSEVLYSAATD